MEVSPVGGHVSVLFATILLKRRETESAEEKKRVLCFTKLIDERATMFHLRLAPIIPVYVA
jgi:hypothetical protein